MIDHAYDTILHSFSKKVQKQILAADEIEIRPIRREEYPLLTDFLYDAIYFPEGAVGPPREIIEQPELAVYIADFGQPDDLCLVAESYGHIIGAVWTRILAGEIKGYGNIDNHTPEFAISVKKDFRQQGIGSKLMQEMIALLKSNGYEKTSLSVNKDNYAYQMYQKLGFQVVKEQDEDYLMVLKLREQ
ncbi:MAG: GNAT family N-acetyltransferase [Acetatifactor sp.]|nr:GNAT family N-acetyltransferase [Acetatifactor sp.]